VLDVPGPGNGLVDVYDPMGNFQSRLISNGALDSPWGMAMAPPNWGAFGGALLVGNFGNGWINAFNPTTGQQLGSLQTTSGSPVAIPGLWTILFGNDGKGGDAQTLYFTAGTPDGGTTPVGLLGSIAPPASVQTISNGASYGSSAGIAPGEIVFIEGQSIGPSPLVAAVMPSTGTLATTLGGATVTFNGTPAPILYTSATFTSVIVPYEVAGSNTASVVVSYGGETTGAFLVPVVASAPGVFTMNESGSGAAVAFNVDGTVNSSSNAAAAGSVILLFETGEGQTDPAGQDGAIFGDLFRTPVAPVSVTIGGQTAKVLYAGSLPGDVSGLMGIEVMAPTGVASGAQPVVVTVGSATSQASVTVSLQ
jgi:uncharacterized protein (TIGR03437 family)